MVETETTAWALVWQSRNRVDGITRHFIRRNCVPVLFKTRKEARDFNREYYGYIKGRQDLRAEPHGWKMPLPIKVTIKVEQRR